jgi:hypothetical protein
MVPFKELRISVLAMNKKLIEMGVVHFFLQSPMQGGTVEGWWVQVNGLKCI